MSDPVDLLERAASNLEEMAFGFGAQEFWLRDVGRADLSAGAVAWAKKMGPKVASSLIDLLRQMAVVYDQDPMPRVGYGPGEPHDSPVLRFARLILDER